MWRTVLCWYAVLHINAEPRTLWGGLLAYVGSKGQHARHLLVSVLYVLHV